MKLYKFTTLLLLLLIFSCNKDKKQEEKIVIQKEIIEPKIEIENLIYSSDFDGVINEGDYEEVVGVYVANRLNGEKKALSLDGLGEYVKIENHEKLNPENEITLSVWYKPISFKGSGNNPLILKPNETPDAPYVQYQIGVTGNEYSKYQGSIKFGLSVNNKFHFTQSKNDVWTPGNWYNITCTFDGKAMKLYVNGVLHNKREVFGKLDVYKTDLYLGRNKGLEVYTPGIIDNFKLYDRALTDSEVLVLFGK